MRLADVTFCVLDLETTGCDAGVDAITEIGAVKVRGGECLGTFHTLVNARQAVPTVIAMLTGISDAMLADAPVIDQVLPSFLEFARGTVIVGHNVRFDLRFLDAALAGAGYPTLAEGAVVDTLPLARRLVRDEVPNCSLSMLATVLGLGHLPTHRALDDARATVELLHVLIERATGYGVMALDDLFEVPRLAAHPQFGAKLPLTNGLPREPGVYLVHGARDEVLHVGTATDVRRHVRRYFASTDRRRIGPMLREARRVSAVPLDDPVAAEVSALRLLQRHRPRYDRAAVRAATAACYIHLDARGRRGPAIVREPRRTGPHLGPLPTMRMAQLAVDALGALEPAAASAVVVDGSAAGFDRLSELASARVLAGDSTGAARLRSAAQALAGAVSRQRLMDRTRARGTAVVRTPSRSVALDHGLLTGVGLGGGEPDALAVPPAGDADWAGSDRPLPRWAAAEVLCVGRRLALSET
jgi:DNA polymerase-3 subunit epsilon